MSYPIKFSLIGLALTLGIAGCVGRLQKPIVQPQPTPVSTVSPTPSPTASATPDEAAVETITSGIDTSDWPTYRSNEYEFEVKYPKGWYFKGWKTPVVEKRIHFSPSPIGPNNDYGIYLDVHKKSRSNLGYEVSVSEIYKSWGYESTRLQNAIISGKKIIKSENFYFFESGTFIITFNFVPTGEIPLEIYNAMLLTFRTVNMN